jgi:hypothetical protein
MGDAVVNTLLDEDVRRLVRDVLLEEMQDEKLHAICVSGEDYHSILLGEMQDEKLHAICVSGEEWKELRCYVVFFTIELKRGA